VPRPGGNPKIKDYAFKTDRNESLTAHLSMRVTPSMLEEIKTKDNWTEFVRSAIAKALKEEKQQKLPKDDLQSA